MCTRATHHFARALHRQSTDAERLLWFHLRDRRLAGATFRRQHPVGPFIAAFLGFETALIIELDGARHGDSADAARTAFLTRRGFQVLRFWNHDVLVRTEHVLDVIHREVTRRSPRPGPPAEGEGPETDCCRQRPRRRPSEAGEGPGRPARLRSNEG